MNLHYSNMLTKIYFGVVFLTLCGFAVFFGCKDTVTGSDVDSRTIPQSNVSFVNDIQPFLEIKCANSGCHDDATRAGGLALTSCASTKSDFSIVYPGNSQNSRIVWAVQGLSGAEPMPPLGTTKPLTANQIRGLKTWIDEGAKCN
jgi:hypothetical protein